MAIKGAIWDLDGTKYAFPPGFTDACDRATALAAREMLSSRLPQDQLPSAEDLFHTAKSSFAEHGLSFAFLIFAHGVPKEEVHTVYHRYAPIEMVGALPGLRDAFADLGHMEHMIYTHATHDWAKRVLAIAELDGHYPDHRIAALDTLNYAFKDADEHGWQHCMDTMGLTAPELAMIDDTPGCLVIPKRLGMTTIQVARNDASVKAPHADYLVQDGAEACRLLKTLSL
jgi:FMN phosphatase YigB (HAD superfamily)